MPDSAGFGRTGHHYNDGIAFKFEDDTYETVFRSIEWQTGRSGEISPVAVFDTVEIDGCEVSKASLHNLTFIKNLELHPGCRILVSKRNMIIPHVEENLDRGASADMVPDTCPCCGQPARIASDKFINREYLDQIRRRISMTQLGQLYEKEKIEYANQKVRENDLKRAKSLLNEGIDIVKIMKTYGFTEEELLHLQDENVTV